jgi:hypothetical protein
MADIGIVCRVHESNTLGGLMNTLFCTPEQGQRLKELLPEIKYSFVWSVFGDNIARPTIVNDPPKSGMSFVPPALTLQELRDIARKIPSTFMLDLANKLTFYTAPHLADWVIARLEEGR